MDWGVAALWGALGRGEMPQPSPGQAEAQGRQCLPWSGNREGFSSFTFRPRKAQGGSWLRALGGPAGLGGHLEPLPLPGGPPELWAQLSPAITHPLPAALLGVLTQALIPQPLPTAGTGVPPPAPAPLPGGWLPGREVRGGGGGELPGRGTVPLFWGRGSLRQPPLPPCLKHPPALQGEQPFLLNPHCFLGTPLFPCHSPLTPPLLLALGHPLAFQGVQGVPPNPVRLPEGSLPSPCPGHAPAPPSLPAGMAAAWLVAEIGHRPAPRAAPSCPQCCRPGSPPSPQAGLRGALGALSPGVGGQGVVPRLAGAPWGCFCFLLCSG